MFLRVFAQLFSVYSPCAGKARTKASAWETKGRGYGYFLEPDKDRAVLLRPSVVKSFTTLLSARIFIHDFFIFTSGSW